MFSDKEIANVGADLRRFLALFAEIFASVKGVRLLTTYVNGQLSDVHRKTCEAIALRFNIPPRTLQGFLASIKWDEGKLRDKCIQLIAEDHSHPEAIGLIDESGIAKSGSHTAGVSRQYNGNRGKVENSVCGVHLGYATPELYTLLDSQLYLPRVWADDWERRRAANIPDDIVFQTKLEIAIQLVTRALKLGVKVAYWTFDELYGGTLQFLDELDGLQQAFVAEIPRDFHVWTRKPQLIRRQRAARQPGRSERYSRVARRPRSSQVKNLAKGSLYRDKRWQKYRIKDTGRGAAVWEIKNLKVWRRTAEKLCSRQHTLIVARNVLTKETKYFISNRVIGRNGVTLRQLLRVAFGRWQIEACFRTAKEELGMDHFEVRGWRCIHRHYYVTALTQLFCNRLKESWNNLPTTAFELMLTIEQIRQATAAYLDAQEPAHNGPIQRAIRATAYYQLRNATARKSHAKTRKKLLTNEGIDIDAIKSCKPPDLAA